MSKQSGLIQRYQASVRVNHWFLAITFILLTVSGLALFYPSFFFLSYLLGGGPSDRILHPFIGVAMYAGFIMMALRLWRLNYIDRNDQQWIGQIGDVIHNREENLPPVGFFNAGQKYLFWTMVISISLLFITGIIIWRPYFAPYMPILALRLAVLIHSISAFVIIAGIIVHIYAAIWVKGSIGAMTRGTVTRAWARQHHLAWYRKIDK
ncbi:MAG: formate dehydrogenase subunit gamma [Sulfuriferula sp.]